MSVCALSHYVVPAQPRKQYRYKTQNTQAEISPPRFFVFDALYHPSYTLTLFCRGTWTGQLAMPAHSPQRCGDVLRVWRPWIALLPEDSYSSSVCFYALQASFHGHRAPHSTGYDHGHLKAFAHASVSSNNTQNLLRRSARVCFKNIQPYGAVKNITGRCTESSSYLCVVLLSLRARSNHLRLRSSGSSYAVVHKTSTPISPHFAEFGAQTRVRVTT